jgi:hypothetical protein
MVYTPLCKIQTKEGSCSLSLSLEGTPEVEIKSVTGQLLTAVNEQSLPLLNGDIPAVLGRHACGSRS